MKTVLMVIGIALLALLVSIGYSMLTGGSKDLSPAPQEEVWARMEKEQQEAIEKQRAEMLKNTPISTETQTYPREGVVTAVITIAGKGDFTMELYPKAAPKTVARISELMRQGFYNGILIHRVEDRFVVQFGDPQTRSKGVDAPGIGSHGSGQKIPFETNNLKHMTGSVAMALNSPKSDTADSQLFINLDRNAPLDGSYCVFGFVSQGMDVVRKITRGDKIEKITMQ
jgi:cyclophilin family peptidyl-prolyl cis-trans isomerase